MIDSNAQRAIRLISYMGYAAGGSEHTRDAF